MLSSVLKSPRAVQVNIAIMRAFVRLRQLLATHRDLAEKLAEMEKKYDKQLVAQPPLDSPQTRKKPHAAPPQFDIEL